MARTLETPIQKRFSDVDPFQHVNNVSQQMYFDVGKMEFYEKVLGAEVLLADLRILTVSTSTSYLGQVRMHDPVRVTTTCERVGTKSLTLPAAARRRRGAQRKPLGDGRLRLRTPAERTGSRRLARTAAGRLVFQPSVAAQFRQAVADIILIAYHHEDDAREDEDRGGDVRGVRNAPVRA